MCRQRPSIVRVQQWRAKGLYSFGILAALLALAGGDESPNRPRSHHGNAALIEAMQASPGDDAPRTSDRDENRRDEARSRKRFAAKQPSDRRFSVIKTLRQGLDEVVAREYVFHLLVGAWVFCFGATVGSFLNVVVYRLPAGKSLVRPGSRCPKCDRPIRPIHNVPILGWLILRGRCRDCGLPISPRYPLVEGAVAMLFLLLAIAELFMQGGNLPARETAGTIWWGSLWARDFQFAGVYLLHAVLLCTLIGSALIHYDGHRLPASLILPQLIAAVVAPLWWPSLRPVPVASAAVAAEPEWSLALAEGFAGLALGVLLGALNWPGRRFHPDSRLPPSASPSPTTARERILPLMLIGVSLGWQAVAAIAVIASAAQMITAGVAYAPARPRRLYTLWLVIATLAWIVFWKPAVTFVPALGAEASWPTLVVAAAFTMFAGRLEFH